VVFWASPEAKESFSVRPRWRNQYNLDSCVRIAIHAFDIEHIGKGVISRLRKDNLFPALLPGNLAVPRRTAGALGRCE
jgi:hypothetical protein